MAYPPDPIETRGTQPMVREIIDLDEKTIQQMMMFGFATYNREDGVYDLTEKGRLWLKEYLDKELERLNVQPVTQERLL